MLIIESLTSYRYNFNILLRWLQHVRPFDIYIFVFTPNLIEIDTKTTDFYYKKWNVKKNKTRQRGRNGHFRIPFLSKKKVYV